LGKTNILVPQIGFGGIPIYRLTHDEAVAVVKRCLALGVTFIDTATSYGQSEERIGEAIAGQRQQVVLATKSQDRTAEGIAQHLQLSLERLRVDAIDLYQFHGVNDFEAYQQVLDPDGPMRIMQQALASGRIKHLGITSHSMDVAREAVKSGRFETIMFPFNFVTSEPADELLPLAREHDVGFIAMKPLAGGRLDNATLVFKYLLQFPDVVPIPGIQSIAEIEEIVAIAEGPLEFTAAESQALEQLKAELGTRFCRRCDYCLPCPEGILISFIMNSPGFIRQMTPDLLFTQQMNDIFDKAANCLKDGECEEKCPYKLPIRDIIEENVALYYAKRRQWEAQ